MTSDDQARSAALAFARATAGDDDERYAQLFVEAYALLRPTTEGVRRPATGTASPKVLADPMYLRNIRYVAEDDSRLINGVPTRDFPDCVAVGSLSAYCCTGTLIAANIVLTAAHCVTGGCASRVFIGDDITGLGQVIDVEQVEVHPGYRDSKPFDDIALLVLKSPAQNVAPRRIARADTPERVGQVRLVGFGTTESTGTLGYGIRREVDVAVATADSAFGARALTEFVAGSPIFQRDSCPGDSGGPAYVEVAGEWLLAGATSRGTRGAVKKCGDGGIYERVGAYASWLDPALAALARS